MTDLIFDIDGQETGDVFFYHAITEAVVSTIPVTVRQHFQKQENRKELFDEIGEKAFLMPKELKFPVINPFTKEFDCRLIYAAIIRAKQHKYPEVEVKAKKLYEEHKCKDELKITLKENSGETEFTCDELFEIFSFDFSSIFENKDAYQDLFNKTLKDRFKAKSIVDLSKSDKKKFFNILEKAWTKEAKK